MSDHPMDDRELTAKIVIAMIENGVFSESVSVVGHEQKAKRIVQQVCDAYEKIYKTISSTAE